MDSIIGLILILAAFVGVVYFSISVGKDISKVIKERKSSKKEDKK